MKKTLAVLIILVIVSFLPALFGAYKWSSNIYALITVATLSEEEDSMYPYDKQNDSGFLNSKMAQWILMNMDYPYESCSNKLVIIPECGIPPIVWAGRHITPNKLENTNKSLILIEYFVQKGLSIDDKHEGMTAVHEAIMFNQAEYLSFLLTKGADPGIRIERAGEKYDGMNAYEYHSFLKKNSSRNRDDIDRVLKEHRA